MGCLLLLSQAGLSLGCNHVFTDEEAVVINYTMHTGPLVQGDKAGGGCGR